MAKLKDIKGSAIQYLAEDPVEYVGTWSSGGSLNTARYRGGTSGVTTAGLVYTGRTPTYVGNTEQYDGTSWTELNDVNNNAYSCGGSPAGSYTAALKSSGKSGPSTFQTNTELWDGTNWTEVNDTNTGRDGLMGAGTSTSNILAGGQTGPSTNVTSNESWDGTSWTEVGDLNNAKGYGVSWGSSNTNAIMATGEGDGSSPTGQGNTAETWNGSSWTATTSLNTGRTQAGAFGSTSTNGIVVAGYIGTGYAANCESFDGSAWTEVNDTSNNLGIHFGSGTDNQSGFVAGGNPVPSVGTQTEEWSFPPATASALTEGDMWFNYTLSVLKGFGTAASIPSTTWASGGSLNNARYRMSGSGGGATVSASMLVGGYKPGSAPPNDYFDNTETYDGTSFTEVNNLNSARAGAAGFGSSTSAIMAGGTSNTTNTEQWDGTNWTEIAEINTGRSQFNGAGLTGTAGIVMGGIIPPGRQGLTETWNGTSWTELNDLNTARDEFGSAGSQTSAAVFGGFLPTSGSNTHEQWDGLSWTSSTNINTAVGGTSGSGSYNGQMLKIAGYASPGEQVNTEFWNGSSWTEINNLSTKRSYVHAAPGTAVSCLLAGGYDGTTYGVTTNEEFVATAAVSTVTTS